MGCAVRISSLVAVAVVLLNGLDSLPEQQLVGKQSSEIKDITIRSILLDDHPQMRALKCVTMDACKLSGGMCQSRRDRCEGDLLTGRAYCRSRNCGCCVPPQTQTQKGCVFGDTAYPHGDIIDDACIQLVCVYGDWKYIGQTHRNCGECIVHGDPHIVVYGSNNQNTYSGTGNYAISQPGFEELPLFGIVSNFEECYDDSYVSCIRVATYFEPGINVTMILPPAYLIDQCNGDIITLSPLDRANTEINPLCIIKVLVNGEERTLDNSVESFYGTDGNVLVFKHNHIDSKDNLNCINVVGSKGFSVSLCQHHLDYAWLYIWAMPSLQNSIYGLCDTFPGNDDVEYTTRDGNKALNYSVSADSWKIGEHSTRIAREFSEGRCTDNSEAFEIQEACNHVNLLCPSHTGPFSESCVFDLCHVVNPERYLAGYATHALVHRQISVSAPKCNCGYRLVIGTPISAGCHITEPAPANASCHCNLYTMPSYLGDYLICTGNVVHCKNRSSRDCIWPGTDKESCEQGQGNCGGYQILN